MGVKGCGPGDDPISLNINGIKATPQADHHSPQAAIADDQVGADPDRKDGNGGVKGGEEGGKISSVKGLEQPVRRTAHPQPGEVGKRAVGGSEGRAGWGGSWATGVCEGAVMRGIYADFNA